jgi:hypothetical protein
MKPATQHLARAWRRSALFDSIARDGLASAVWLVATGSLSPDDGMPLYARTAGADDHGIRFIADPNAPIHVGCKVALRTRDNPDSYEIGMCVAITAKTVSLRFAGENVYRVRRPPHWVARIIASDTPF